MQKNCPKCRKMCTKKYGKNSDGKQKYKCKRCSYCFVDFQKQTPRVYGNKIFDDWIEEGYSCRQLGLQKKKNSKDIQKHLDSNEIYQIDLVFENIHHVMIDGKGKREVFPLKDQASKKSHKKCSPIYVLLLRGLKY